MLPCVLYWHQAPGTIKQASCGYAREQSSLFFVQVHFHVVKPVRLLHSLAGPSHGLSDCCTDPALATHTIAIKSSSCSASLFLQVAPGYLDPNGKPSTFMDHEFFKHGSCELQQCITIANSAQFDQTYLGLAHGTSPYDACMCLAGCSRPCLGLVVPPHTHAVPTAVVLWLLVIVRAVLLPDIQALVGTCPTTLLHTSKLL